MLHLVLLMISLYSLLYKTVRFFIKYTVFLFQWAKFKHQDLEDVVIAGHKLLDILNKNKLLLVPNIKISSHLKREIYDLEFSNPLTFSSYESNLTLLSYFLKLGIAGGCYKTMMPQPRSGNLRPRLQELVVADNRCLINAMGLPGPGARKAINDLLSSSLLTFNRPIGLSLGGESPEEYYETFSIYNNAILNTNFPFYYELNISCPNTEKGKDLTNNIVLLENLIEKIRENTLRTISVKVSPDQTNDQISLIAEMLTRFDKIMINAGNTQFKSMTDVGLKRSSIAIGGGGLSGEYLFSRTCEMIDLLSPFKIPIIATGGISNTKNVRVCLEKGASLVGMASALAFNPYIISKILKELK